MRLDKWLWAARFFKTRSLAQQALAAGRVQLNGERTKPAHEVKTGDRVVVRVNEWRWEVTVRALSERRGPAAEARKLYDETEASRAERLRLAELRRWGTEPAAALKGRPTKRDRRQIDDFTAPGDES
ncbi:MAG: RNA-binding S4 domain-containing protein [Betaproteobacteria bacterium]|jgi:ribosome-associated heat shock protein Hsp15|nr:RNA-binding S4 domain-containing protein [Betaproteobacteria bacterium]